MYEHHLAALIIILTAGVAAAQPYPEIVIPVSEAEARRVLEQDPVYEERLEGYVWASNGRFRIAKIDGDVLSLTDQLVQFSAFPGAEPIVLYSHGIDDQPRPNEWHASRIKGHIDQDILGPALRDNPHVDAAVIEQKVVEILSQRNQATLKVGSWLQDPDTGEYLLKPSEAEVYAINPSNGDYQTIESLERVVRQMAEKDGLIEPCTAETRRIRASWEKAAEEGKLPSVAPLPADAFFRTDPEFPLPTEPPACAPLGDVFEMAAALSPATTEYWHYKKYRRGRPLPANAVTAYAVVGSNIITTDRIGPTTRSRLPGDHAYHIERVTNNPAYVFIFEWAPGRRWPSGTEKTENADTYNAHMEAVKARIEARNEASRGDQ
jgi:hypothetical protein